MFQGVSNRGPSAQDLLIQDLLNDYHSSVDPSGFIDLSFHLWIRCVRFDKDKAKLTTSAVENYVSVNDTSPIPSGSSGMQSLYSGDRPIMTDRHTDRRRQIYIYIGRQTETHRDTKSHRQTHRHTHRHF